MKNLKKSIPPILCKESKSSFSYSSREAREVNLKAQEEVVAEYPADYCFELEAAYGPGMMSEGGAEAIDRLFDGIDLTGKQILDIGSGMGGVVYHVAQKGVQHVSGLEINPWMVQWARANTDQRLKSQVSFALLGKDGLFPFESSMFDLVYSKGVFTHVPDKNEIFAEINRVL